MDNPFEKLERRMKYLQETLDGFIYDQEKKESKADTDLLNVDEAAEMLGVAKATLYTKSSKALIPHMKRGNRLYFSKSELIDWLKKARVKTALCMQDEAHTYINVKGAES